MGSHLKAGLKTQTADRILELIGCGILIFDREGHFCYANARAEQILGLPRAAILGRTWEELGWANRVETSAAGPFCRVLAGGETVAGEEIAVKRPEGARLVLEFHAGPMLDAEGRLIGGIAEFADITDRKRMEEDLRASEQRFHRILEQIHLAALVQNSHGRVAFCNDFLLRLLGRPQEEVKGSDWFEIGVPPEDCERARQLWRETVQSTRTSHYLEFPILTREGERRLIAWNTIIERNEGGDALFCASIGEDITERRRAEEVLRRSDRIKSEFISTAAHELRTPMTTIIGYADLLLHPEQFGGFPPEQQQEFLQEIHDKAEVLAEIVGELLDLGRIEAGLPIPLDLVPCNLDDLLLREVRQYRSRFPGRRFLLDLEERCPPGVLMDANKMEQVLENLLSNAVKYSPEGGPITIAGRMESEGYRIAVTDEGIGMAAEQVAQIFNPFYRADASDTARPGLGVGMSIVRGIVEAHGGRITVESAPGQGTTIAVILPVKNGG